MFQTVGGRMFYLKKGQECIGGKITEIRNLMVSLNHFYNQVFAHIYFHNFI